MTEIMKNLRTHVFSNFRFQNHTILLMILTFMMVFFTLQSPYFLTTNNLLNILIQISEVGLIAIPMTLVIISGAMDLSVGSILGLSAVTLGMSYQAGADIFTAMGLALLVGLLCGALNGILIAKYQMQAIVVTIGTLVMLRGLVYVVTEGKPISGYPDVFYLLGQGAILGIPINILFLIMMFGFGYILLNRTIFGRYIYALGNNEEAVRFSGVVVSRVRFFTFLFNGLISAVAAIFLVSRLASAEANSGQNIELDVITAVLIGGTHIFGGRGSLVGTLIGLLIIGTLRNGLNLMGVSVLFQTVILGILILIAVGRQKQ
jgi:ribose transport system permease protein